MAGAIARTALLFRRLLSGRPVTYARLMEETGINRRTALRWIDEARQEFPEELKERVLDNGEKEFWLDAQQFWMRGFQHQPPNSEEVAALDVALRVLRSEKIEAERAHLTALRSKLHQALEKLEVAPKTENDAEAISESLGVAVRPGPRIKVPEKVTDALREALLQQRKVAFRYENKHGQRSEKRVAPAGVLYGGAARLVGIEEGRSTLVQYRLDRVSDVEILDEPHDLAEDTLRNYVETLFGSFGEAPVQVKWRFHPSAPEPEKWEFHKTQTIETDAEGWTVVRFRAGGLDDMARHIIGWWDWIEIVAPRSLREAVLRMKLSGLAPLLEEFADKRTATRIRNLASELGANRVRDEES